MNARTDQVLIEKLNSLAPQQRAEVEDFVDFLKARRERDRDDAARRLGEAFAKLDALNPPPVSSQDVQAEIEAARAARRARDADCR
jgi:predicted KAP-like P-loop ATPase